MSTATSTRAIKTAIRDAIVAIFPSFDYRQAQRWEPVEVTEVTSLRRFWLHAEGPGRRVKDAGEKIWGIVEHWKIPIVIRVGYGDLPADHEDLRGDLVTSDNVDLDKALRDLVGVTDGLISVDDEDEPEVVADGDRWLHVNFRYEVGYYQENT